MLGKKEIHNNWHTKWHTSLRGLLIRRPVLLCFETCCTPNCLCLICIVGGKTTKAGQGDCVNQSWEGNSEILKNATTDITIYYPGTDFTNTLRIEKIL